MSSQHLVNMSANWEGLEVQMEFDQDVCIFVNYLINVNECVIWYAVMFQTVFFRLLTEFIVTSEF